MSVADSSLTYVPPGSPAPQRRPAEDAPRTATLARLLLLEEQVRTLQSTLSELIAEEAARAESLATAQHSSEAATAQVDTQPESEESKSNIAHEQKQNDDAQAQTEQIEQDDAAHSQHSTVDESKSQEPETSSQAGSVNSPDHVRELRRRYFTRQGSIDDDNS